MTTEQEFVPAMSEIAREAGALLMPYFQRRIGLLTGSRFLTRLSGGKASQVRQFGFDSPVA